MGAVTRLLNPYILPYILPFIDLTYDVSPLLLPKMYPSPPLFPPVQTFVEVTFNHLRNSLSPILMSTCSGDIARGQHRLTLM